MLHPTTGGNASLSHGFLFVVADKKSYNLYRNKHNDAPYFIDLYNKFVDTQPDDLRDMQQKNVGWVWEIGVTGETHRLDELGKSLRKDDTPPGMLDGETFLQWFQKRAFQFGNGLGVGQALSNCIDTYTPQKVKRNIQAWIQKFEKCKKIQSSTAKGPTIYYVGDSLLNVYNQVGMGTYFAGLTGELMARYIDGTVRQQGEYNMPGGFQAFETKVSNMINVLYNECSDRASKLYKEGDSKIKSITGSPVFTSIKQQPST